MKRLQLPKNKLARLAINVGLIVGWLNFWVPLRVFPAFGFVFFQRYIWFGFMYKYLCVGFGGGDEFHPFCMSAYNQILWVWIGEIISIAAIALVTKYIWTGRIRPKRRITTSLDD